MLAPGSIGRESAHFRSEACETIRSPVASAAPRRLVLLLLRALMVRGYDGVARSTVCERQATPFGLPPPARRPPISSAD